jgi:uncharacterized membrane protein YfcA
MLFGIHETVLIAGLLIGLGGGLVFGIFGGGSGLILMPGFYFLMSYFPTANNVKMQVAIATTAAASAALGFFATYIQHKRGHLDRKLIKDIFWGLTLGAVAAVLLLNIIPSYFLKHLFAIMVLLLAIWMWFYRQEKDKRVWHFGKLGRFLATMSIGLFWYLLGIGVFMVPYLHKCGIDIRRAVGCATLYSTFLSGLVAMLLMLSGTIHIGSSAQHIGFLNLPLFLITLLPCVLGGYLGAQMGVRIPQYFLKKTYAGLMLVVGILMLV